MNAETPRRSAKSGRRMNAETRRRGEEEEQKQ
jgi:hypothetical protein